MEVAQEVAHQTNDQEVPSLNLRRGQSSFSVLFF